jgi:Calcineurin-like phosphoesterase
VIRGIATGLLLVPLAACGQHIVPSAPPVPSPSSADVETSLFLIGDAGQPTRDEPVLTALRRLIARDSSRSLVLFLGDNIYPRGLPRPGTPGYDSAAARLDAQIRVLTGTGVPGYFLPGNHDWDRFGDDGWNAIRRQETRIREVGGPLARLLPGGGCPGPHVIDVRDRLRLILLDTQWWLQGGVKPRDSSSGCPYFTTEAVQEALRAAVRSAGTRNVVVAGHHPLASGGEHGGFFDWKDHLFPLRHALSWLWLPLPGIGSAYPIARGLGVTSQDISSRAYSAMIRAFGEAFEGKPPLIFAAGHEHGLQVIEGGAVRWQLVSGAGISRHEGPLVAVPGTLLALQAAGFMRVDLLRDGRVRLGVLAVDRSGGWSEVHSRWLNPVVSETPDVGEQQDSQSCGAN